MNTRTRTVYLTQCAIIAALYVALSCVSQSLGLASGAIQCRISEALCVLPIFTAAAVPGVTIGCFVFNLFFCANIFDVVFGTLATLIGVIFARMLRHYRYLAPLPTIISNAVIIPFAIIGATHSPWESFPVLMLTVGIGEIISCGIFGTVLTVSLYPVRHRIFKTTEK